MSFLSDSIEVGTKNGSLIAQYLHQRKKSQQIRLTRSGERRIDKCNFKNPENG